MWLALITLAVACGPMPAQVPGLGAPEEPDEVDEEAPSVRVADTLLQERMDGIARRSLTWQAAMDTLRASGFRVLIASPAQVRERVPALAHYHPTHLGEVLPQRNEEGELTGAVVIVDLPRLETMARDVGVPRHVLLADVDRILIHEIYGHVVPLAQTRTLAGGCPDPAPGEPALSSCAIRRENRIRSELGLEMRTTYDIRGLVLGRYLYGARPASPRAGRRDDG